jgi:hypothetical protein
MGRNICVRNFRDSGKRYEAGQEYKDENLVSLVKLGVVKDEATIDKFDKEHIQFVKSSKEAIEASEKRAKEKDELRAARLKKDFDDAKLVADKEAKAQAVVPKSK